MAMLIVQDRAEARKYVQLCWQRGGEGFERVQVDGGAGLGGERTEVAESFFIATHCPYFVFNISFFFILKYFIQF